MSLNIRKLFALKKPCANCPFLKENGIPLEEGRLDGIKDELTSDDQTPFFCHKTTYDTGGGYDGENENYSPSGKESYCMGAMAYLYAKKSMNVPMRLGLTMGLCKIEDIENSVQYIEIE